MPAALLPSARLSHGSSSARRLLSREESLEDVACSSNCFRAAPSASGEEPSSSTSSFFLAGKSSAGSAAFDSFIYSSRKGELRFQASNACRKIRASRRYSSSGNFGDSFQCSVHAHAREVELGLCNSGRDWGLFSRSRVCSGCRAAARFEGGRRGGLSALSYDDGADSAMLNMEDGIMEGPSCIYVGPVEDADVSRLEALYQQARDEYYSGHPLILDEMFDKVEKKLRQFRSKLVRKYPRCSLRRYTAYADAEFDQSQMIALAGVWSLLLAGGVGLIAVAPICLALQAYRHSLAIHSGELGSAILYLSSPMALNGGLLGALGFVLGAAVATAAVRSLKEVLKGSLVALKGTCPACGEEVYAFIRAEGSVRPRQKSECHVCEQPLVFHATLEESKGHIWAFGRIYLVIRTADLSPRPDVH